MVTLQGVGNVALSITLMILSIIFTIIGVWAISFLLSKKKKFSQFKIIIFNSDAFGKSRLKFDKAGIFVKNKNKRLWLQKNKVGLSCDNIPSITSNKKEYVFLLQTGLKNFRFINPNIAPPLIKFRVGEEDVNWATAEFDGVVKKFSQKWLEKYLPFIIWGFSMMVILIIFIYFFKEFHVLKDVAIAFQEASKNLILAKTGPIIIP